MIFHENRLLVDDSHLLADDSHVHIITYFCRKLGKMSEKLSSAAVLIGALRVKKLIFLQFINNIMHMLNCLIEMVLMSKQSIC